MIGWSMMRRVCPYGCLFDEKSFVYFLAGVVILPSALTSWAIILNFHLGGYVVYETGRVLAQSMLNTTITDAMGVLIMVPLYDALTGLRGQIILKREIAQFIGLSITLFIFLFWVVNTPELRPIVLLIPLTGLALRNGVVGSSVGVLFTTVTMIFATVKGYGPYAHEPANQAFTSLITFLFAIGLPVHLVAISIRNVKRLAATLEQRVELRTAELKEKESKLVELNSDKDRLMSIIGHDLRNPIQGIIGLGELVVSEVREKEYSDVESYGVMIQSSARQTLQLLQNLLDWSATHSGSIRFNPQPTDVSRLVGEALHVVSDMAKSKGITLQVDVEMGLSASVDKQMMSTILRNLVSNSLKFTSAGGTILASAHSTESGFRLSVADTGVGMTQDQIQALAGPLSNTSTYGTEGEKGSGLGLLLVFDFTQKHGGTVQIESEPGRGTTIALDFPTQA
jgi:signal transduction histidine kinase